jgi:hypothetical protein
MKSFFIRLVNDRRGYNRAKNIALDGSVCKLITVCSISLKPHGKGRMFAKKLEKRGSCYVF